MNFWKRLAFWIVRRVLSLRYEIEVKNLDKIKTDGKMLFLPNHPAEIDPIIMMCLTSTKFNLRPLVVDYFYYASLCRPFMNAVKALPVPSFETTVNHWKFKQVEQTMSLVKDGINRGDNFLIYPSGRLKSSENEALGGASFVHKLVQETPSINLVLVRTTGLYGSIFSRAITGKTPDFWKALFRSSKVLFKNGFFFAPKRKVVVEFSTPPKDFPYSGSRLEFNKALENWYNDTPDPLTKVSYSRFKEVYPEITKKEQIVKKKPNLKISDDLRKDVYKKLEEVSRVSQDTYREDMELATDLGLDSLDIAGMQAFLDERYGVENLSPQDLVTVYDLLACTEVKGSSKNGTPLDETIENVWPSNEARPGLIPPQGSTIQESFLMVADRLDKCMACGDAVTGLLTYKQLKRAALILSQKIALMPGRYIAIMLPSSVGAYLVTLACQLAKKIPVMLNWTAGVRSLDYAQKLVDFKVVLSSRKFLERAEGLELGTLEPLLHLLEDIKGSLTLKDKLQGVYLTSLSSHKLIQKFKLDEIGPDDPAVLLFTSGTETFPKAVPLTHRNILENQVSAFECVDLTKNDVLYGVLPPFHSFGFSVTGLFPILSGIRVFFSPDPTDSVAMAHDIKKWKITIMCCAPSFYKNLFRVAKKEDMSSVRLFVTGAEKASKELFDYVHSLGEDKAMIEGYGITECAPIVTLCRPHLKKVGVGQPIPNVTLNILGEDGTILGKNQTGEVIIKGPNVFQGYMGPSAKNPFIEIDGSLWYRSGDLAQINDEGHLLLGGRLKRFVKIGGEMISLTALEEELSSSARKKGWYSDLDDNPSLAVCVREQDALKTTLLLYTTFDVSREDVNSALRESGFGRIVKIAEVRTIPEIPMTGTGKVHYRRLEETLGEPVEQKC